MIAVNLRIFKENKTHFLWILFGLAAVLVTARNLLLPSDDAYTHYNNYVIFKYSFSHLIQGLDLYQHYPQEHYDLYKYSPSFALFMGLLSWLPDWLGLALWNLLNVLVLVLAIRKLPAINSNMQFIFGLLALQESITATINSQSNVLIAGLLILAWAALEEKNFWKASIFIGITVFIKLFGLLFFALFLLYPKWWKGIIPAVVVMLVIALLPLPILGITGLKNQYISYLNLLGNDHGTFVKYSILGWLQSWFHWNGEKNKVVIAGLLIQLLPLVFLWIKKKKTKVVTTENTALFAAALMIWMVIFNHMAESATFIIAVAGVLLWFFYSGTNRWFRIILLLPVMAFTCFGPSDIYPPDLRQKIVMEWQLKVFPCILVWVATMAELFRNNIFVSAKTPSAP